MTPNFPLPLLWLDLETTGLDDDDSIIEIGCALTDTNLNVIDTLSHIIAPDASRWATMLDTPVLVEMHTRNGLINDVEAATDNGSLRPVAEVEAEVVEWLDGLLSQWSDHHSASGSVWLAGSGVSHFDQRMLRTHMPNLESRCRYATFDIGVVRRMHDYFVGTEVSAANDAKTHRALDDVRCHIAETRAFVEMWRHTQGV